MKRALITGIGGQDGSLLAELLLEEGYEVVGLVRPGASRYENLAAVEDRVELYEADLLNQTSLAQALRASRPHEVYNLAAPSFVPATWEHLFGPPSSRPSAPTSLLEAIRIVDPNIRFYQASSSEIFGDPAESPQTEETPLAPVTPYGVAKAYAHFSARSYRHRYGSSRAPASLYNHESPRRPLKFLPAQGRARGCGNLARSRRRAPAGRSRCDPRLGVMQATMFARCG
jgi:GDPmannose 4,6-dehydratase